MLRYNVLRVGVHLPGEHCRHDDEDETEYEPRKHV